ncbi:DUF2157 domain-containing protein [Leptospira kmetyi]|uniref:DUF2157 domain-containing protein n=1 Tax=Leptospira kmetyi TaxID=408139 RepID=UPI000287A45B|nr:DUF2157 domain-containing protein [Leptospira kmetyi]EQA52157.1 membrane protein, PF09925 family [Leptospira kmetyi serovar Malaysia str. Bejo-Iso9]PJZ42900.1 DUF2157 domain-containing protein [Leptospira kmetyi]TGK22535.1 DUF2157 domain-containing protein [Leptospira kmetyi]TGK27260.1 DUF2157 domain-containing protein [Leptospira kmetyi]
MRLEQKLKKWVEEGLIRSEQSDAILKFEETRKTPYLYYSFIVLGVFVIGIGVIAIIAANWEELHDFLKLGAGLSLLVIVSGLAFWKRENPNLLTVFTVFNSMLILGMIGLVSQVYHRGGEYYEAAALWCILNFLFLLATDSKTLLHLWLIGFQIFLTGWILDQNSGFDKTYWENYFFFCTIGFYTIWLASEKFSWESRKGSLFLWTLLFLVAGSAFWGFRPSYDLWYSSLDGSKESWLQALKDYPWSNVWIRLIGLVPGVFLLFKTDSFSKMQKKSFTISLVALFLLYFPIFFLHTMQETFLASVWNRIVSMIPALLFVVFWLGIASAFRSHKRIFDLSIAVIGIRFLYFYFDLFGSLSYTGFGLILSGILIIALTVGYLKFKGRVRTFLGEQE